MDEKLTFKDLEEYVNTLSADELMDLINTYCSLYIAHVLKESEPKAA